MKKFVRSLGVSLALIVSIGILPAREIYAVAGQWSANGNSMYYNDGAVGLGTSNPDSTFKLNLRGGSDASLKYNIMKIEAIEGRNWNIRTLPFGHANYGSYGLVIEQPASTYNGCSGCGGDLVFMPWENIIMTSYNTAAKVKVGINTKNPTKELSVDGTILARELIISNNTAYWPDYVFDEGYDLKELTEVEAYIREHGHLPNIPDAQKIESEGVSVGEMQRLQMEKIEELTLYAIDLEKENIELKSQYEDLSKRLERLEMEEK